MCEVATLYFEKQVKLRKPRKCCETGRIMPAGEMAWKITGLWDGQWQHYYQSEAAFHFARYINRVGTLGVTQRSWKHGQTRQLEEPGSLALYDAEACLPFGEGVRGVYAHDEEIAAVKQGILTRWTLPTPPPPHYVNAFVVADESSLQSVRSGGGA